MTGGETQRFAKAAHLCPVKVRSHLPSATLHIRTLQSSPLKSPLQEATSEPSAEKLTPLTCELYFGCKLVTTFHAWCCRLRLLSLACSPAQGLAFLCVPEAYLPLASILPLGQRIFARQHRLLLRQTR